MGAYVKNFIDGVSDQKSLKTNDKMDWRYRAPWVNGNKSIKIIKVISWQNLRNNQVNIFCYKESKQSKYLGWIVGLLEKS